MDNKEIEVQALIMIGKGYEAENQFRIGNGNFVGYGYEAFEGLASDMRQLKTPEGVLPNPLVVIRTDQLMVLEAIMVDHHAATGSLPSKTTLRDAKDWLIYERQHPTARTVSHE